MNESIDISLIIGILLTMAFSAFFSGTEIAFVSSNRMLFEVDKERHGLSTRLINFFYRHPNDFVSTMLVGNNVVLVIYGILIILSFLAMLQPLRSLQIQFCQLLLCSSQENFCRKSSLRVILMV